MSIPLPVILADDLGVRPVGRPNASADALDDLTEVWWSVTGSNRRPPACKAGALPAELTPRMCDGGSRRT